RTVCHKAGYTLPEYRVENGKYIMLWNGSEYPLQVFGRHNLLNIMAAYHACSAVGITDGDFFNAIATFHGASNRLECLYQDAEKALYRDFAHSPSKLKATVAALKEKDPERHLVACMELHTFSSLTASFLEQYAHAMDVADEAIVYFNPHAIALKKLPPITEEEVHAAFGRPDLKVFCDSQALFLHLCGHEWRGKNLLMMSSGNYDGMDVKKIFG
ncbi:MAG: peptidoglycan synthetase, partial [Bacteroidales bacterium]|nr:peptidoglycan synthetase [Bacteroidales bacterium]